MKPLEFVNANQRKFSSLRDLGHCRSLLRIVIPRVAILTLSLALLLLAAGCQTASSLREAQDAFNRAAAAENAMRLDSNQPLSGGGADPTGRSRLAFARYKGEAETALSAAGFPHVYMFRPAYIYPVEPRKEPTVGYRFLRAIYPLFRVLFPNQVIRADDLARTMVDVAVQSPGEGRALVLENRDIRHLALRSREHD